MFIKGNGMGFNLTRAFCKRQKLFKLERESKFLSRKKEKSKYAFFSYSSEYEFT